MMTNFEYTRIDAENKALKKRIEKLENSIEQIRAEIADIIVNYPLTNERNKIIGIISKVLQIIDKHTKGDKH